MSEIIKIVNKKEETKITETEKIFKEKIKQLRMNQPGCINQSQTAKNIGISQRYYNTLETADIHKQPSFEVLEKIATNYNIKVYELFKK